VGEGEYRRLKVWLAMVCGLGVGWMWVRVCGVRCGCGEVWVW
jgi:hypothetical protein